MILSVFGYIQAFSQNFLLVWYIIKLYRKTEYESPHFLWHLEYLLYLAIIVTYTQLMGYTNSLFLGLVYCLMTYCFLAYMNRYVLNVLSFTSTKFFQMVYHKQVFLSFVFFYYDRINLKSYVPHISLHYVAITLILFYIFVCIIFLKHWSEIPFQFRLYLLLSIAYITFLGLFILTGLFESLICAYSCSILYLIFYLLKRRLS